MSSGLALEMQRAHGGGWKRYPAYRDSGVEWLGAVPEGWGVKRLKYLASESLKYGANESAEIDDPDLPRYIRITDIAEDGSLRVDTFKSLPEDVARPYLLKSGDILFARSGATVGKSFIYHESWGRACYAGYLIRLRVNSRVAAPAFLSYFASSSAYWDWTSSIFIQATIQNISAEKYANLSVAIPPLPEQHAIAAFLDRETGRIDALIAKKERQIKLLQEKRTALISHAVTKGLDPDAPMKDSGVEWLGAVPAHWESLRLKWVAKMESGHTPNKKVPEYWENCNIPWVSLNDTAYLREHDYIEDTNYRINELGLANSSARLLPSRAVVFTRDATIGLSAITTLPMAVSQHIIAWLCEPRIVPEYLLRVFYAMTQEFERLTMGSTIKTIGMPDVNELKIPVPPLDEQIAIVKYVLGSTDRIDMVLVAVLDSINLLREYRTALISAAVTGKIDVRSEET